jgi:hypothetical protein
MISVRTSSLVALCATVAVFMGIAACATTHEEPPAPPPPPIDSAGLSGPARPPAATVDVNADLDGSITTLDAATENPEAGVDAGNDAGSDAGAAKAKKSRPH